MGISALINFALRSMRSELRRVTTGSARETIDTSFRDLVASLLSLANPREIVDVL